MSCFKLLVDGYENVLRIKNALKVRLSYMSFKYLKKIKTGFSNVQKKHCTRLFLIIYLFKLSYCS